MQTFIKDILFVSILGLISCHKNGPTKVDLEYKARKDLQFLKICVNAYVLQNQKAPESLLSSTAIFDEQVPKNWKESNNAIDPWGNPYNFTVSSGKFMIWSLGANQTDESGKGDDICVVGEVEQ